MKIVSLIASSTEIVCALGLEKNLVGRSHECDYPAAVAALPACSEPKINIHATSKEIDRQVKDVVAESLSVYRVHTDTLKKLNPDIIVTQDQCEVCAVSFKDVETAVCDWLGKKPAIVSLKPENLEDIFTSIEQVGRATNTQDRARELVSSFRKRIGDIAQKVPRREKKLRVACIEWIEPLMAAGNWVPELVDILKAENLFGEAGKHSPWMTWEELQKVDPDIILAMPCGWDIGRINQEMPILEALNGWRDLKAVKKGQVYITDGNQYFNRPGPRIVESLEIMAEIFYPDKFHFGHHKSGWEKYR
jgi:iron complex transport system substrate-binding protein